MRAQNIKVEPESIKQYGKKAQQHFDKIRQDLQVMANTIENAPYQGDNAADFKNECAEMMAKFSKGFLEDLGAIAQSVRTTTTNIAQALGGQPIIIKVDGTPIKPQKRHSKDGKVQSVDTIALKSLPTILNTRFDSAKSELRNHLRALDATAWEGNGKKVAVDKVGEFTRKANSHADEAKKSIIDYVNKQLEAVFAADC